MPPQVWIEPSASRLGGIPRPTPRQPLPKTVTPRASPCGRAARARPSELLPSGASVENRVLRATAAWSSGTPTWSPPMPQIHLRAEPTDYAPVVLLPGDPNRATAIPEKFDGGPGAVRQVNAHRGLLGYTGTYKGVPVSVQTSGMGAPSMSSVDADRRTLIDRKRTRLN